MHSDSSFGGSRIFGADTVSAFEILTEYFRAKEFQFTSKDTDKAIHFGLAGESGNFHCGASLDATDSLLTVIVRFPVPIPEEKRLSVAEFFSRASFGMGSGRFDFNWNEGDAFFQVAAPTVNGLGNALIDFCITAAFLPADHFFPFILKVAFGSLSPAEAVAEAQAALKEE